MMTDVKYLTAIEKKPSALSNTFNEIVQPIRLECMKLYVAKNGRCAFDKSNHAEMIASRYYANLRDQFNSYAERANKHGVIPVSYAKPRHNWGRVIPYRSQGLTCFSKQVRNALIADDYYDFDLKNCQPEIILNLCKMNGIPHLEISNYCENRDKIFDELSVEYDVTKNMIKKLFLRLCFFGEFKGWCIEIGKFDLIEHVTITRFINNLKEIAEAIKKVNKQLFESARQNQIKNNKKNFIGSMFALFVQEYELRIVESVSMYLLNETNVINDNEFTYEYDGLKLPKNAVDKAGGVDVVLRLMNDKLKVDGWDLTFEEKPIISSINLSEFEEKAAINLSKALSMDFEDVKERFEESNFKIVAPGVYGVLLDGIVEIRSKKEMRNSLEHLVYHEVDKKGITECCFIDKWVRSPLIRRYENLEAYAYPQICPPNHYNTWQPFRIESYPVKQYDQSSVDRFINHIDILCGRSDEIREYFLDWMAHMFQMPGQKPDVMPIFIAEEGAGKGTLIQLFEKLIHEDRVCCTTKTKTLIGDFNENLENTYLICFDELCKSQVGDGIQSLKELVTGKFVELNKKGKSVKKIKSNHRVIGTTDTENGGLIVTEKSRRWWVIRSSDELIPNKDYFYEFYALLDDDNAIASFYKYLIERPNGFNFKKLTQPKTNFHVELTKMNRPIVHQFIEELAEGKSALGNYTNKDLYANFIAWRDSNGFVYNTNSARLMCEVLNSKIPGVTTQSNGKPKKFDYDVINEYFMQKVEINSK